MEIKSLYSEKYLEERFIAGYFPSILEMLDSTTILEVGDKETLKDLKKWRRKLYQKFHKRKQRRLKKVRQTTYSEKEDAEIHNKSKRMGMSPDEYRKYAQLNFPLDHTPTLCKADILACRAMMLQQINVLMEMSRDSRSFNKEGFCLLAENILSMREEFEILTGFSRDKK